MKKHFYAALLLLLTLSGCNKLDVEKGTPRCVRAKIKNLNAGPCEQGANVKEYLFQGKTVYMLDNGTCGADFTYPVIDADCNELGALGGLSGGRDINGIDFYANAEYKRTVWEQ